MTTEKAAVTLSSLSPNPGSKHRRKRIGFGEGSGNGKTCGKGQKGQRMRAGFGLPAGFEGGQMPIHRRLPKRGFVSRKKVTGENVFSIIRADKLVELAENGKVTIETLQQAGFIRAKSGKIKILGGADVTAKLTVETHAISESARAAIEGAGGEVVIVTPSY